MAYTSEVISSFQRSVARTFPELVAFCRSLPDARRKVASERFEFPILSRYPFFRSGNVMICWHPMVFYRGLESFVHSVLSEEGQEYMKRFSRLFERHVVAEAGNVPARFVDEDALREFIAADTQVPDGLLSFPGCNVFIESKAGLYHESGDDGRKQRGVRAQDEGDQDGGGTGVGNVGIAAGATPCAGRGA